MGRTERSRLYRRAESPSPGRDVPSERLEGVDHIPPADLTAVFHLNGDAGVGSGE